MAVVGTELPFEVTVPFWKLNQITTTSPETTATQTKRTTKRNGKRGQTDTN